MPLHTILGAGGAIANELVPILQAANERVRLVSRTAHPVPGAECLAADVSDATATLAAVRGSSIVYLLVGLPYDTRVWQEYWPRIMTNVIEACAVSGALLLFFDNVYMYGRVQEPMIEETPFNPISRKGEVRARIARQLLDAIAAGKVEALIARSADFYGPAGDKTSVPNMLVFANVMRGKQAQWLCNADVPHSLTFIPDAARALYLLSKRDAAFGQTWHLPTAENPLTGREFVAAAAATLGTADGVTVLPGWMLAIAGLFNRTFRESVEMAYQYEYPYLFNSTKFTQVFGATPTAYEDGIEQTGRYYRSRK